LFHITVKCDTDDDCRDYLCAHPTVGKCIYDYCHCIVMITIEEKLSHQSGINKVVRENRSVSIDPTIKGKIHYIHCTVLIQSLLNKTWVLHFFICVELLSCYMHLTVKFKNNFISFEAFNTVHTSTGVNLITSLTLLFIFFWSFDLFDRVRRPKQHKSLAIKQLLYCISSNTIK